MNATATTTPEEVAAPFLEQVSIATGIKVETLLGSSVDHPANKARQTAIALIYQLTLLGCGTIGSIFRRDHKAVYYSLNRVAGRVANDPVYARHIAQLVGRREIHRPIPEPGQGRNRPKVAGQAESISTLSPATHGRTDQLNERAVTAKLEDAREQLAYWTMKKARAFTDADRNQASARILIWTGEVTACERRLRELTRTEALTA